MSHGQQLGQEYLKDAAASEQLKGYAELILALAQGGHPDVAYLVAEHAEKQREVTNLLHDWQQPEYQAAAAVVRSMRDISRESHRNNPLSH